jgi:TPR repeat protein
MKKIIILTILLITTVQFTSAQNAIAKLKFEEAEEAFVINNFELTLSKVKEIEILLKSTNPKLLHLKILAENKIIQEPIFNNDQESITQLKTDCDFYLKKYETIENNEEKYREVYKISETIKKYKFDENKYNEAIESYLAATYNLYHEGKYDAFTFSLEKIALKGNVMAITTLGQWYSDALNDYESAAKWYQKAIDYGETDCMVLLGHLYKTGGESFPRNSEMAISLYSKASDLGNISGITGLVSFYLDDIAVPINEKAAFEWFNKAAKMKLNNFSDSSSFGQVHIIMCYTYFEGKSVEKNYAKVEEFANKGLPKSAKGQAGELFAMLGAVYKAGGYGVTQDYQKAFNCYKASSDKDDFNGMIQLADLYKEGLGTKKDKKKALVLSNQVVQFYEQYANEGDLFCMNELVKIYEKGIGCDVNTAKVSYWKTKAAEQMAKEAQ